MVSEQEEFDEVYISSGEIRELLGICRAMIVQAKNRGILPAPITVNGSQLQLWKRKEVMPQVEAWKIQLQARRGVGQNG